jgi:class B basic helix-loop-helix protein 8
LTIIIKIFSGSESSSSDGEGSGRGKRRRTARRLSGGGVPVNVLNNAAAQHRRSKRRVSARERNLRRLESNERERMRMHSLNDAFEVRVRVCCANLYNTKV